MSPVDIGLPRSVSTHERLVIALQRGATLARAAQIAGVPEARAHLMVEHLERVGLLRVARPGTGCDHGACSSTPSDGPDQALHCAGCPMAY